MRAARGAVVLAMVIAGAAVRAQSIATADLQIQGAGLRVLTVSATTGVDIPASIQTEFGGKQNDQAPNFEGLIAVGELDGPGIERPLRLETAPGYAFAIPALSREGLYFLRDIRLMKGTEFLQPATPSVATITVSNLLQTAVKVRQLTVEELRARGITLDARNYDVFEYTFSFIIDGQTVEIPYSVVIDKRTREIRELPRTVPYVLPPIQSVRPPRWSPPIVHSFGLGGGGEEEGSGEEPAAPAGGAGGGRPSIPAALVLPNDLAVLHQFFAVTLMVTNGAPAGSSVTLDRVTAMIRTPAGLRVVKSVPAAAFHQPVPVIDANSGVTFLVAQAKGDVDWTVEGLEPGTHTLEVEVRATYKSPGQADFPLKGTVRATVVVHDPRFHINFSHPDTVREGIDYTTYSFITNMSPVTQSIRVGSGIPSCEQAPAANVCRLADTPEFHELTIPTGEMRSIEHHLRPGTTGRVFASAGSVNNEAVTAAVQLFMGVSETGVPLSPATLVMPYYVRYVDDSLVEANLQLLGLGYSLATAPLTQATATQPRVIRTDVYQRAVDIARAGQRVFIGEEPRDAAAHLALDLLGNAVELREWDDLRRREKSGRGAGASVVRELEKGVTDIGAFVERFATKTAHREGYVLALLHGPVVPNVERPYALSVRGVASNRRVDVPNEAGSGWIRELPFGDLSRFDVEGRAGEMAIIGSVTEQLELTVKNAVSGPHTLEVLYPGSDGKLRRARLNLDGPAGQVTKIALDSLNGTPVVEEELVIVAARQDLRLGSEAHQVSVLFNRPAGALDWLARVHGEVILDKDGVSYRGPRPISAAALQEDGRILNLTFDHALSKNAAYSIRVDPFPQAVTPIIDNDRPGGIVFGHVLKGDNTPISGADVQLSTETSAPQFDTSAADGSFLFEFVARDLDNGINGQYSLSAITAENKSTSVNAAVRLPGRVHFVNLVFLGRGSAEGYVRYDDGSVVKNARVTVGSTMFDQWRKTTTDANGFYRVADLPVGPLTFTAMDAAGNMSFAASELRTPGEVATQDLSIFRRPFPGTGTIRGIVKRSDTNEPVPGAMVGVYSQGYGLVDALTDSAGRFEFTGVPSGFVTVLAAEWSVSRESVALDFDLGNDESRDVTLTLNVAPNVPLVTIEGDVIREDPLHPNDPAWHQRVPGAIVKIEHMQPVTADANGHYLIESVPQSKSGQSIDAYDPLTKRSATKKLPSLDPSQVNLVPIFISTADGAGDGTVRVRVLNAQGLPATGLRVINPGFPPTVFTELANGIYTLQDVPAGEEVIVYAISTGGTYGDQFTTGKARVEFNGHVAAITLRLLGQGTVRVKLRADIDVIGDVRITYPAWQEAMQNVAATSRTLSTEKNGLADYAVFEKVPAHHEYDVSALHPVYGYAGDDGKLAYDGDLHNITLQLNKLSTVRGVVYAIDGRTPIPGAAVRIEDGRQDQGVFTTLPDGSFVFHNEPAHTGFRVVAEVTQSGVYRTGFANGATPAIGGPVENIAVVMRTQGSIDARIVYAGYKTFDPQNPANNIIDDTPGDLTDNAPVPLAKFALRELAFPTRSFGTLASPLSADVLGRFSFNNLFTGPLRVTASDPGNQEMRGTWTGTLSQEGETLTAYIGIGATGFGSATIEVVDPNVQNAPVLNAEVSLQTGNGVFDFGTTDGAGNVTFEQLPIGTYHATAFSKSIGRSGASGAFGVIKDQESNVRVVLEFSGEVTGQLIDPEAGGRGVPGAHVNLDAFHFFTRATTDVDGDFLFEGVREGTFRLSAKDTLTNRRASAQRALSQADPRPHVVLQLEPTETLHLQVYQPDDAGGASNVLVPLVEADVTQCDPCDFTRSLQGNPIVMEGLLEQRPYKVVVTEVGGARRKVTANASFPKGSAADPLKLAMPAYGSVEVHVTQSGAPAANAKVTVSGSGGSKSVYTDASGVALATGIRLGAISAQAVSLDGAFSGSASATLSSQSTPAVVTVALGAYAGIAGYVEAEMGGPSIGTRVVATFTRTLEAFTDSNGRYAFNGIPTGSIVSLVYVGPDEVTVGARQSVTITAADAQKIVVAPNVRLDATVPQLISFTPADGAQNVSPDTTLTFVFSEPIRADQINRGFIQLIPADGATAINAAYTSFTDVDGTFVVRLIPPPPAAGKPFPLESNTLYRIIVSGEIRDLTGNKLPSTRGAVFVTSDYAEPRVVSVTPSPSLPLQPATSFRFTFNEPIQWNGTFRFYRTSAGSIVAELPGRAFLDPANPSTLVFAPDAAVQAQSFYRTVFSGVSDLQGNAAPEQTFDFFSFDAVAPFVLLQSPVPAGHPLTSGVEYLLRPDLRDGDANGPPATDIARVEYFRADNGTPVFVRTETKAPFAYRFVGPDAPAGGGTLTLRAEAVDLSNNRSAPASMTWNVQPNAPPRDVAVALTPADASYANNRVSAVVTFDDEGLLATVQLELKAAQKAGGQYVKSLVKQAARLTVDQPWGPSSFDFDLPAGLAENGAATFTATVTDARGQATGATASLTIREDAINPALLDVTPAPETRYTLGTKYQVEALVQDLETGIANVSFQFDGQTINVTSGTPGIQPRSWRFVSGQITVPAKNIDTRIPILVTATDYHGNNATRTVDVIYAGVNDPAVPKGAWLCPIDKGALPANETAFPITMQVRATDDISVTGVKFRVPGMADVAATRVGTSTIWQATANIATPAAETPFALTAIISDANPDHDVLIPISIEIVAVDIIVADRIQAITAVDVATYENKSILVRGPTARLVPHVPLTLENLLVLDGARVETLSTTTTQEQRLDLTVTDRLSIDCASSIDVSVRGYLGGWGLNPDGSNTRNDDERGRTLGNTAAGGPTALAGASHAGLGGIYEDGVTNAAYGSITDPSDLGTGGGGGTSCCSAGATGGGAVRLRGGVFSIAGAIRANGGDRDGTGNPGAGGSVNVAGRVLVTGPSTRITANGGDDDPVNHVSRGGGGGRIAIAATERLEIETLGMNVAARGGRNDTTAEAASYVDAGAGTIFVRRPGQTSGELFAGGFDDRYPNSNHLTRPTPIGGTLVFDRVELGARALVRADASVTVNGVTDDRTAITAAPGAVILFAADRPAIDVTTTPAANASLVQGTTLSTSYSATSPAGIGSVRLQWTPVTPDRVDGYSTYPLTAAPSAIALSVPATAPTGAATLTVTATDRAGRSGSTPLTYTIVANAPPSITRFDVVPLSLYPGKSVAVTASASDDVAVTKLSLTSTIDNGTPATQTKTPNVPAASDLTFSVAVPIATPGGAPMTLTLAAEDGFAGRAATTQTVAVTILTDANAPSLAVTAPAADTLFQEASGATIQVRATASDAEVRVKQVFVQLDGGTQYPLTAGANNTYSADIPLPPVDGAEIVSKQLVVTAKDYQGNIATSVVPIRIQPLYDPNAPVIAATCFTDGAMAPAGYAAKFRVYAIGNNTGNSANGVQKVELFVNDAASPMAMTAVAGLANHYEAAYAIPAGTADGTIVSLRAVATNTAGLSSDVLSRVTVVTGTVIAANTTIAASDASYDGKTVIVQSGTTTITGAHTFTRLLVLAGAKVTHVATDATTISRLTVDAQSLYVACDATIDASGLGFTGASAGSGRTWPNATTGGSINGAGGSHGGRGGAYEATGGGDSALTFGSAVDPDAPGGAGGAFGGATCATCNAGGGIARLKAAAIVLDGKLLANGASPNSGGGAGGSIRIDAGTLAGAGEIHADGTAGTQGAGGGGRIAVYYQGLLLPRAKITAAGGSAANATRIGGAGTIYFRLVGLDGARIVDELVLDNLDRSGTHTTPLPAGTFDSITIRGAAVATSDTLGAPVLTTTANAYLELPSLQRDALTLRGWLKVSGTTDVATLRLDGGKLEATGLVKSTDLTLANHSTLTHPPTTATTIHRLVVDVANALTVDATSTIDVSGRGFSDAASGRGRTWPGTTATGSASGAGGSHGGRGGAYDGSGGGDSGPAYGSLFDPNLPGAAGGAHSGVFAGGNCTSCNAGGGIARIDARTIAMDGKVLANGVNSGSGGGAGGSIRIDAETLSGNGEIRADGGPTAHAAGGGGRVAVYYDTLALSRANITAAGGLHTGNSTRTGAAGTVYLKASSQTYGDLVVDNLGRITTKNTPLTSAGFATVTESGATFVKDANANFASPDLLAGLRLVLNHNTAVTWPITGNDAKSLTVAATTPLTAQLGDSFRGLYRFDSAKLRNARLEVLDLFEATVDKDAPSVVLGSNRAPVLDASKISVQSTSTASIVAGTAGAAIDPDQPLTLTATNTASGNTWTVTAAADGSFLIPVQGNAGDTITLKARDANFFPLETTITAGTLATGTPTPSQLDRTQWTADPNFRARRLAMDDRFLTVYSNASTEVAVLSLADPSRPNFMRTINAGGPVNDVAITNGWAVIAANDLVMVDLNNPASTPTTIAGVAGAEMAVTIAGGYAYAATNNADNGRIHIYDVSNPSSARFIREHDFNINDLTFVAMASYGNYLLAMSSERPFNAGYDLVVIDRTNIYNPVRVKTLDIPSFDATGGWVSGSRLYMTGANSRDLVIVSLTDPHNPSVVGRLTLPANAQRAAAVKTSAFVADGTAGLVEVDAANAAAPLIVGSVATGGTAYDVRLLAPYAYVANDNGIAVVPVTAPPQIEPSRVSMSLSAATVTITGVARAVTGIGTLTIAATNGRSGVTSAPSAVNADGSFTAAISALTNDPISIEATDSAGRKSGPVSLGLAPFGAGVGVTLLTPANSEPSYHARTLATGGTHLIVGGYQDAGTTALAIFDVTNPAAPLHRRTVPLGAGAINAVGIRNGWAIVAADELVVLDLGSDTSVPRIIKQADGQTLVPGNDLDLVIDGGTAFTTTNNADNARLHVYDVNNPANTHYLREFDLGINDLTFTGLAALGSRYLVAMAGERPFGVGHDAVVIDRSDVHSMVKVADLDIQTSTFNGFRGKVLGTTLYLAGTGGGVAVVDLSNPASAVVRTIVPTGDARGIDIAGSMVAVANGSAGVAFLQAGDPSAPQVLGTQLTGGAAWSVAFNGQHVYVANDQGLAVIPNVSVPLVHPSRVTITPASGTLATISGSAAAITGLAPLQIEVKNARSGASISGRTVSADGSFSVVLPGSVDDIITVEATDAAGRRSGRAEVGRVPFGSTVTTYVLDDRVTGESFRARTLATDGTHLVVAGWGESTSTSVAIFDVTDAASPRYVRTVPIGSGPIYNVGISNGWAVIAANDVAMLDLSSTTSTPKILTGVAGAETDLLVSGGYAFTATNNADNGRLHIYDVSRPSNAAYLHEYDGNINDLTFTGLAALGDNHLLAFARERPFGHGHDLVVFERSNVHGLVKRVDLDLDTDQFNAFRGKVVGTTLYLAGRNGGLAIYDMSNPVSPVLLKQMFTAGSPYQADGAGGLVAVADGGSGVTFLDVTNPASPVILGTQAIGGTAWSLAFNRGHLYVANELGLVTIRDIGAAPTVTASLVDIGSNGIGQATITGRPRAISGVGAMTVEARNAVTGTTANGGSVAGDGSFSVTIAAQPGQLLTVEATDEAGRKSGRTPVGTVPFGVVSSVLITPEMSPDGHRARTLATDGKWLITGGYGDTVTTHLNIFDVSDSSAPPQFRRSVPLGSGAINALAIHEGWAIVAANDLVVLDLNNPTSVPDPIENVAGAETDLLVSGGYAFTTTSNGDNGRIHVYDVADPSRTRYIREQDLNFNDVTFTGLAAVGSAYMVASTRERPFNAGHDVVVIDRSNPYALRVLANVDILGASFDAFRGKAVGSTLYLGGIGDGLAVVDLSTPSSPVVKMILQTAGDAFGVDVSGSVVAVADGSAGVTFLDVTNPFAPSVIGTQPMGGTVWSTQLLSGTLYAVNEQSLVAVRNVATPVIESARISIATDSTTAITVSGAARAITGVAPLSVRVRNTTGGGSSASVTVAANGGFTATLAAVPNNALFLDVTDAGGRTVTHALGGSPFGSAVTRAAGAAQAGGDDTFRARRVAASGTTTVTGSGSTRGISGVSQSGNVLVFRNGVAQSYDAGDTVSDVVIHNGYALIAAADFSMLDLSNPAATPFIVTGVSGAETSVAVLGSYAYTATTNADNSRLHQYDIANPAAPKYVREYDFQINDLTFSAIVPAGASHLVAVSPERPFNVGHDVVIIDAANPAALAKRSDLDIDTNLFNAVDVVADGTWLYVAGNAAGIAVVDIANPVLPVLKTILKTPGAARGVVMSGPGELAVADGSSGITIIDVTNPAVPVIRGTQRLGDTNTTGVHITGRTIHAVADDYYHVITRPE